MTRKEKEQYFGEHSSELISNICDLFSLKELCLEARKAYHDIYNDGCNSVHCLIVDLLV